MNNTEIFEFCEICSKLQCFDCNLYWEAGIGHSTCGRCLGVSQSTRRSTRATTMSCQYLTLLSRRITSAAPGMDLLSDKECITRRKKCCIKLVKKSMENTHPFLRDGITTTNAVKGMYPAPHIHEHLATANCEPQPGPHCEQWHGHHKAHGRVQCAVLSTPRTVC